MAVAVERDLVSLIHRPAQQVRMAPRQGRLDEEGSPRVRCRQRIQDSRRPDRVWAVVERQGDVAAAQTGSFALAVFRQRDPSSSVIALRGAGGRVGALRCSGLAAEGDVELLKLVF